MNKKLICFDMDHTLIDSDKAHILAYNKALKQLGFKEKTAKLFHKHFSKPKIEVAKAISGSKNINLLNEIVDLHNYFVHNELIKSVKAYPNAKVILKKLNRHYKIAIVSNSKHETIVRFLKKLGIKNNLYDALVGYDDVKRSKPAPDVIIKAGKILRLKPEFMIGDSIYDVKAGKRAKAKTIAVASGNYNAKTLLKENPDFLVYNLKGVEKILLPEKPPK